MKQINVLSLFTLTNATTPYNYYLLALQNWCESPKSHYQIHGL